MNKTININLGGFAFQIEEDAYNRLQSYLQKIEIKLGAGEETTEIIEDIEFRIAELFKADEKTKEGVITLDTVQEIIKLVGEPEDIISDENDETEKQTQPPPQSGYGYSRKSLFRDVDRTIFGGVCSGLARYINIDPVILRLLFVVAVYFWPPVILVYIVLWIAMPIPRTPAQWFEMKGGSDYYNPTGRDGKKEYSRSVNPQSTRTTYQSGYYRRDIVANGLRNSGDVISVIIGLFLSVISFILLISLVVFLLFQNSSLGVILTESRFIYELPHRLLLPSDISLFSLSIGALVGIPLLAIFYLGLKLIFKFHSKSVALLLITLGLWFAGIALFFYQTIDVVKSYKESADVVIENELQEVTADTLYINTMKYSRAFRYDDFIMDLGNIDLSVSKDGQLIIEGKPNIIITHGEQLKLFITKKARGLNQNDAERNAEYTEYFWQQQDSVLLLDRYFTLGDQALIRNQEVTITLQIPRNMNVKISPELESLITTKDLSTDVLVLSQATLPIRYYDYNFNFINRNL